MRRVTSVHAYVYICVVLFCSVRYTRAQGAPGTAAGSIRSVSTDQPCLRQANPNSPTVNMECNEATIVDMDLVPEESKSASAVSFQFISLPDSGSGGSQSFSGSATTKYQCKDSDNPALCTALQEGGGELLNIDVTVSKIVARWTLEDIGLTVPFAYYYNTSTSPSKYNKPNLDQCAVAQYQSEGFSGSSTLSFGNFYDLPAAQDTYEAVFGSSGSFDDVFSKVVMAANPFNENFYSSTRAFFPFPVPDGSVALPQTSGTRSSSLYGNIWPDDVYRRWYHGLLGAGGEILPGKEVPPDSGASSCANQDTLSTCACINPISSADPKRPTTAVCPGSIVQGGYGQRNGNAFQPLACSAGACAGSEEARCPFLYGFTHGSSRCLASRTTADQQNVAADVGSYSSIYAKCNDECRHNSDDPPLRLRLGDTPSCVGDTSSENVCNGNSSNGFVFDPNQSPTLEQTLDNQFCYCAMRYSLSGGNRESGGRREFFYPALKSKYLAGITKPTCPVCSDGITSKPSKEFEFNRYENYKMCSIVDGPWTAYDPKVIEDDDPGEGSITLGNILEQQNMCCRTIKIDDVRRIGTDDKVTVGSCGRASSVSFPPVDCLDTQLGQNPCACACQSDWNDIALPVAPVCTVYRVRENAEAMYNITVHIRDSDGNTVDTLTVGTSTYIDGISGETPLNTSKLGRVSVKLEPINYPRGDSSPRLGGYVVVCGDRKQTRIDDLAYDDTRERLGPFVGSPSVLGTDNPFEAVDPKDMDVRGRTPLPSTFDQLERLGVLTNITRTSYGNTSTRADGTPYIGQPTWWYYVPPERVPNYGQGCNQIGWNNYGSYDVQSASAMCQGRTGTCVPGYDFTGEENVTEAFVRPPVQVPAFVARTFVEYENAMKNKAADEKVEQPEHLPPNSNAGVPNYWMDGIYLYSNTDQYGDSVYSSGSTLLQIRLAVAGELLQAASSLSNGELRYSNGEKAPPDDTDSAENTPLGGCQIGTANSAGGLNVRIVNVGSTTASYSLRVNCTNTVTEAGSTNNVGVPPGDLGVLVGISLEAASLSNIMDDTTCTVSLVPGDVESAVLDTLPFQCVVVDTVNFGAGGLVLGNPPPATWGDGPSGFGNDDDDSHAGGGLYDNLFPFDNLFGWLPSPWDIIVTVMEILVIIGVVVVGVLLVVYSAEILRGQRAKIFEHARMEKAAADLAAQKTYEIAQEAEAEDVVPED